MSDDNSCLFHSISHCLAGQSADGGWSSVAVKAAEMRQLVAASILSLAASSASTAASASSSAVSAYLSSLPSVSSYAAAIGRSDVWGGALECAVLSEAFSCRIHAVDVESGAVLTFGSSGQYVCYLLFSGVHYDSLYCECECEAAGGRPRVTMFRLEDSKARDAALAAGQEARAAERYTSLSAFTLRCAQCGVAVRGEQEAQQHCKETNHTQFDEYRQ